MCKQVTIRFNGFECHVDAYASDIKDLPSLLCQAGNAVNELIEVEEEEPAGEEVTIGPLATKASAAGFEANGQILAKLAALLQTAITNAPELISEISAIIALFGGKLPAPTPSPSTAA